MRLNALRCTAPLLLLGACATAEAPPIGEAEVAIHTAATQIPPDGECAHVIATRLADFTRVEFRGLLSGAVLRAPAGDYRVTATAYPQPCNTEPSPTPWVSDERVATFAAGGNTLQLNFKKKVDVTIQPEFENDVPLEVRAGSRHQTARNGEDIAGPSYSLDGWTVKNIALPAIGGGGVATENALFSTMNSPVPYTPRGMAHLPNGNFAFQVGEIDQPLWFFSAAGAYLETLPVVYPAGTVVWTFTDGLEAIDDTHLVRTGFANEAVQCELPTGCVQAGLDILERKPNPAGGDMLEVVDQVFLRAQPTGEPLNAEYALAVTPVAPGRFAVITLTAANESRLILLNDDETLAAPTSIIPGSNEGLAVSGDGRLIAMTYHGVVTALDPTTGSPRAGETLSYLIAPDLAVPSSLAWLPGSSQYLAFTLEGRLVYTDGATYVTDVPGLDVSGYASNSAIDVVGNEVAIINRLPPQDPNAGNARIPVIDFHDLTTLASRSVQLAGISLPARPRGLAYMAASNQLVTHHRRPTGPDENFDATAYVHNADGTLANVIDLRQYGFVRIVSVNYLPGTAELLFHVVDVGGTGRLLVTDLAGTPRRSVLAGEAAGMSDAAVITSGPFAGDLGIAFNQPSELLRAAIP